MLRTIAPSFAILAVLLGPLPASADDALLKQVQASAARWDETFNKGDAAGVAKLYAKDARLLPAGSPLVSGDDGIQKFWSATIDKGIGQHKLTVQEAEAKGDMAYAHGRWQATGPGPGGEAKKQFEGNWVNVLVREDGEWRPVIHSWN